MRKLVNIVLLVGLLAGLLGINSLEGAPLALGAEPTGQESVFAYFGKGPTFSGDSMPSHKTTLRINNPTSGPLEVHVRIRLFGTSLNWDPITGATKGITATTGLRITRNFCCSRITTYGHVSVDGTFRGPVAYIRIPRLETSFELARPGAHEIARAAVVAIGYDPNEYETLKAYKNDPVFAYVRKLQPGGALLSDCSQPTTVRSVDAPVNMFMWGPGFMVVVSPKVNNGSPSKVEVLADHNLSVYGIGVRLQNYEYSGQKELCARTAHEHFLAYQASSVSIETLVGLGLAGYDTVSR